MKIDNSVKNTAAALASTAASKAKASNGTKAPASAGAEPSSKVEISALASVDSVLANTPVSNAEKVAEIKAAIAEGRFKVNPEKIADGLLNSVRQLLNKA